MATEELIRHDKYQPYTDIQIAQLEAYLEKLDQGHTSMWEIPVGDELVWEITITPELVILYADGVEDYNPWYEAWPSGPGESPFGPAIAPPMLLPYLQNRFHRETRGTAEVGAMATHWRTEFIAPCPIGRTVRYRGRLTKKYIKRGRQTTEREFTIEDAETGELYARHTAIALAKYERVEDGKAE